MSNVAEKPRGGPWRIVVVGVLVAALVGALILLWPGRSGNKIIAYFTSAVGLYPGDDVRIIGVNVGKIDSIEPGTESVKVTMSVQGNVRVAADAEAVIMSPNIVAARFVQLTPPYKGGETLPDGATLDTKRTAVPVEWDEIKTELNNLSKQLGPKQGEADGPVTDFVNAAAGAFAGNGDSFRKAIRELSQTAGRLGDSRGDLFGTVKNLQILIDALSNSNEQIVQFSDHLASVSQVLAESSTDLDYTLGTLNQALTDISGFLGENNEALIGTVDKLAAFTKILSDQSDDLEQVLHVAPNGLANFYNIYNPAQGTLAGLLSLPNFANPVQFICGGSFDSSRLPEYYRRAEICKERMGPVLRRIAMNFPPLLFHPINSITAYKGQITYDTPATQAKAQTPVPNLQWQPAPGVTPPYIPPGSDISALMLPPTAPPGTEHLPGQANPPTPLPAEQPLPAEAPPSGGGG